MIAVHIHLEPVSRIQHAQAGDNDLRVNKPPGVFENHLCQSAQDARKHGIEKRHRLID
jgi:hypothetical protein